MKFIDTVTVFHKNEDGIYERIVVNECYWYGDTRIANSGHGIVRDDAVSVFFPKMVVDSNDLKIYKGDRVVKGEAPDIESVNELSEYEDKITVLTVQSNIVGSRLDNLLITGK